MKFSTRQDTDLTADALFAAISDFHRTERVMTRRGAHVERIDPAREPGAGMAWNIAFDMRGRRRALRLDVTQFDRPSKIGMEGRSDMFALTIDMTVIALTRTKSRLIFEVEAKPNNLRARLMLQTAKLGKTQLDRKFANQIEVYVNDVTSRRDA